MYRALVVVSEILGLTVRRFCDIKCSLRSTSGDNDSRLDQNSLSTRDVCIHDIPQFPVTSLADLLGGLLRLFGCESVDLFSQITAEP